MTGANTKELMREWEAGAGNYRVGKGEQVGVVNRKESLGASGGQVEKWQISEHREMKR